MRLVTQYYFHVTFNAAQMERYDVSGSITFAADTDCIWADTKRMDGIRCQHPMGICTLKLLMKKNLEWDV
jgi:hypothetical protein